MKVLLVGDYPPPYGGIAVQIQHLARTLPRAGLECRVLNIGRGRGMPSPEYESPGGRIDLLRILMRYARSNYLLHLFTNGENWRSWAVAFAVTGVARLTCRKALLTITSGGVPAYLAGAAPWARILARLAVRLSAGVVCRTDAIARALRGWRPTGLEVLPAFSVARLRPAPRPTELVARFCAAHRPLLASVVILRREYDLPTLLQAFRDLRVDHPAAGLVVIGGGEEEGEARGLIRRWTLDGAVLLVGWVHHEECLAIIREADLFVRTTLYDGDASSVREALALGVPVVATKTDFRPEGVFLVPPGSPDALRAMIAEVLRRSDAPRASAPLDHSTTDDALLALYQQLARG